MRAGSAENLLSAAMFALEKGIVHDRLCQNMNGDVHSKNVHPIENMVRQID